MKFNPFKKDKDKKPAEGSGEKPIAKIDVFNSEADLEITTRQKERGQRVDIKREPVKSGIVRDSQDEFGSSARIRELLFHPDEENLSMLTVTKPRDHVTLASEETFDQVRAMGSMRRDGDYISVARLFITNLDKRAISVKGNTSETRNAMLQVHQDMSEANRDNKSQMPMG